ncbi:MAG: hypothetical protein IKW00_02945 [Clostridia bacterium]|nr:hypothetical protein [Clostridia bacterium]
MKQFFAAVLLACMLLLPVMAEEEFSYQQIIPKPHITVLAPAASQSYDEGGKLHIKIRGENVTSLKAVLHYDGQDYICTAEGNLLEYTFETPQYTLGATLTVTGYGGSDRYGYPMETARVIEILAPREKLFRDMFALAEKNFKDPYYYHAPAQEDWDRGICKNFVMRMFDTFKDAYRMKEYPDLPVYMPKNNSKVNCKPYDYGIEWRYDTADMGNPFEIAAQFKYDTSLSKEENIALCRKLLESVEAGDFFQMTGDYYYGKGAHSLLFIADYNAANDSVYWTDSNMKNDNVNGYHYGYMQYNATRDIDWFIDAVCYKNHGCTLYRLRNDLFIK